MILRVLLALWLAVAFGGAQARAVEPDEILPDRALEQRARALSAELRCLVCQNQSIDDSNAPLARDLRLLVREQLKTGATDKAVLDHVVARYGEFVLLRPRWSSRTWLLWLTPLLILLAAAWGLAQRARSQAHAVDAPTAAPLTRDEEQRLKSLLERE